MRNYHDLRLQKMWRYIDTNKGKSFTSVLCLKLIFGCGAAHAFVVVDVGLRNSEEGSAADE
jgi:hypothetical protein